MKLLFDTHAFIWWDGDISRLGPAAQAACLDPDNDLVLSTASVWEMQVKLMLGKLALRRPLRELLNDQIRQNGLEVLSITLDHILQLDHLPPYHEDPFDRILVAQTMFEDWTIISHDPALSHYAVKIVW